MLYPSHVQDAESACCKPRFFLVFLCTFVVVQSCIVSGLISANIATLEKRFGFGSTQSGALASIYEITVVSLVSVTRYTKVHVQA